MTFVYQNKIIDCQIIKVLSDGYVLELLNKQKLYVKFDEVEEIKRKEESVISDELYLLDLAKK